MQNGNSILEIFLVLLILSLSLSFSTVRFRPEFCSRLTNFLENAQLLAVGNQENVLVEVKSDAIKILDSNKQIKIPKYEQVLNVSFGNLIYDKNIITYRRNSTASAGKIELKKCSIVQSIYGARRIE